MAGNVIGDCEIFQGFISDQGYGKIHIGNHKVRNAHAVLWERKNGKIPDGLVLDHLCRNRACVNLHHLELVTVKENTLRGIGPTAVNSRKKDCIRGHPLAGENLIIDHRGNRRCRICQLASEMKYKTRKRALEKLKKGNNS